MRLDDRRRERMREQGSSVHFESLSYFYYTIN